MSFYVQDSALAYWQLGASVSGQPELISVGAQTIVPLVVQDSSSAYWQIGATTSGQPELTSVGATTITTVTVQDSNGVIWVWGATTLGQPQLMKAVYDEDFWVDYSAVRRVNAESVVTVF